MYPFTERRPRETSSWRRDPGAVLVAVKGAPETVLELCDLGAGDRKHWQRAAAIFSRRGEKVIACAWQDVGAAPVEESSSGFKLAGLISVTDPIRPGVREAVDQARAAGIQIVIVTGDHPETASAIAREAGIAEAPLWISATFGRLGAVFSTGIRSSESRRPSQFQAKLLARRLHHKGLRTCGSPSWDPAIGLRRVVLVSEIEGEGHLLRQGRVRTIPS